MWSFLNQALLSTPGPPVPLPTTLFWGYTWAGEEASVSLGAHIKVKVVVLPGSLSLVKIGPGEGVGVSHPWKRCTFWSGTIDGGTAQSGSSEGPSRAPDATEVERGGGWGLGEGLNFSKAHHGVWEVRNTASRLQICGLEARESR